MKTCKHCLKPFTPLNKNGRPARPGTVAHDRREYCSQRCHWDSRSFRDYKPKYSNPAASGVREIDVSEYLKGNV